MKGPRSHVALFDAAPTCGDTQRSTSMFNRQGRSIRTMACYALVIAFVLLVTPTGALPLTFTIVDVPGAEAVGINPQGDIVGFYIAGAANHGFLLDKDGTLT